MLCSVVSDSATPWTVVSQAPLSMEVFRQEYLSGLPFPTPRDLPDPGIELVSLMPLYWQVNSLEFFITSTTWKSCKDSNHPNATGIIMPAEGKGGAWLVTYGNKNACVRA